jgi:hypothetical protein
MISRLVLKYSVLSLIFMLVFHSCVKQNLIGGNGVLKGKISIGPICPVETIPPNPACLPTLETYKAWATAVWTINKETKLATLSPKLDGTYQLDIPSGKYLIDFADGQITHIGGSNLPGIITISNGDTTSFNINIDTGIR